MLKAADQVLAEKGWAGTASEDGICVSGSRGGGGSGSRSRWAEVPGQCHGEGGHFLLPKQMKKKKQREMFSAFPLALAKWVIL